MRGGLAEAVDDADVLIVDFDVSELEVAVIVREEIEGMEEKRRAVVEAHGPDWLVEDIDQCIEGLRGRIEGA